MTDQAPFTIIQHGDRKRLVSEHSVLVVGVSPDGQNLVPLTLDSGGSLVTTPATGGTGAAARQLAVTFSTMSAGGTIAAGAQSIDIILTSDFAGTFGGVAYSGTTDSGFSFVAPAGFTLGSIVVTISAGSARIQRTQLP